ncbi:hypothetical protein HWV62_18390 [Athelia sp. TMB]|nr:hypothetical protein HWV62_18390 [Athelia sp. TMB]
MPMGQQGGRQAAQQITKGIAEYLSDEDIQVFGRGLSFWVTVYFNKTGLLNALASHDICTPEQFESFCVGFSQASPRFLMIDVGYGKDAVEFKIREYIQTFARFPQTLRMFFCGGNDTGYSSTMSLLESEQLLGKLVILEGYEDINSELHKLCLPSLKLDGLFLAQKPAYFPLKLTPLAMPGSTSVTTNGGLMSPRSPSNSSSIGETRLIDPSLVRIASINPPRFAKAVFIQPLHKQNPPPCNEYYLMSCFKGAACKYSHKYELTAEQRAVLANNAKKAPCNFLKNDDAHASWQGFNARTQKNVAGDMLVQMAPNASAARGYASGLAYPVVAKSNVLLKRPPADLPNIYLEQASRIYVFRRVLALSLTPYVFSKAIIGAGQGMDAVQILKFGVDGGKLNIGNSLGTEDHDDLKPSSTPGYKPAAAKSASEYAQLDAEDESLARWKASLGLNGAIAADTSGPKITVLTLELTSPTLPANKKLTFDIANKQTASDVFTIKEGVEYKSPLGLTLMYMSVDKLEQMLGSYGPTSDGKPYTKVFDPEESPSGMLARSGTYNVRSRVSDDDGEVYADWTWSFKLAKEW